MSDTLWAHSNNYSWLLPNHTGITHFFEKYLFFLQKLCFFWKSFVFFEKAFSFFEKALSFLKKICFCFVNICFCWKSFAFFEKALLLLNLVEGMRLKLLCPASQTICLSARINSGPCQIIRKWARGSSDSIFNQRHGLFQLGY